MKSKLKLLCLLGVLSYITSCTTVEEYEKVYINDPDMELKENEDKKFETSFQIYREGASGANGGKSGGGCGCN